MRVQKYRLEVVKEKGASYEVVTKKISSPSVAFELLNTVFRLEVQAEEVFAILCLNTKNEVVGCFEVSRGILSTALVHPREIFKRAIACNSACVLLAHNHPSGNPSPSKEDDNITKRLAEAGDLLGISILDHVIIGEDKYYSYKEENASILESHKNIGGKYV